MYILLYLKKMWQPLPFTLLTLPVSKGSESVRRANKQSKGVSRQIRYLIKMIEEAGVLEL